ncbi:hypothetical protein MMC11_000042 [Xylographa trunciseda]|nr:hypothetical protein [Xylographa trunciseda]
MRHFRSSISPAEALRLVFLPTAAPPRSASNLRVISHHQLRSASSTSEDSPANYRAFRPPGAASSRAFPPRSDRDNRAHEDKEQPLEPRADSNGRSRGNYDRPFRAPPPRSLDFRTESNGRPRENSNRSFGAPAPRSFGPRLDSGARPREDSNRSSGAPASRSYGPNFDNSKYPREGSYRSFGAPTPRAFGPRSMQDGLPRDEAIRSRTIRLVDADKRIQDPSYLPDVLTSIDRKTHFIQQVSPVDDPEFPIPVCKIIDKKENRDQERARAKAIKSNQHAVTMKKLELSWGIGKHDIEHRMNKVREFLEDGRRVEIVVGASRRKGQARKAAKIEAQEAAETFKTIKEALAEMEDAREWRSMEGSVGTLVTISLEPKTKKGKGVKVDKAGDSAD